MESEGQGGGGGKSNHYLSMVSTPIPSRFNMKSNTARETLMKASSGDLKLAYTIQERRVAPHSSELAGAVAEAGSG